MVRTRKSSITKDAERRALRRPPALVSRAAKASGRRRSTPPVDAANTRERIIEAAKQHFSEFGLQHASVRAITRIAGVNSALIRYHFGSKRALYEEVVHRVAKRLIDGRMELLEQLRGKYGPRAIPVEDLLRAYSQFVLILPDEASARDAAIYLRFFGRMYTEPSDELRSIMQSQFNHLQTEYIRELSRAALHASLQDEIIFRFGLLIGAMGFPGREARNYRDSVGRAGRLE